MTREQFLQILRKLARESQKELKIVESRGKGSHFRISFGGRTTTIKSGEMTPSYVKLVKKQLGIDTL